MFIGISLNLPHDALSDFIDGMFNFFGKPDAGLEVFAFDAINNELGRQLT